MSDAAHRASVAAPAKINLYLRIVGRRPDGFHELDTLLLPLEHADRVEVAVTPAEQSRVTCTCPGREELSGRANLAWQAAARFLEQTEARARVEVTVHKRIWTAAGLGGGSSDAAAVLRALQGVLGHAGPLDALALGLGADVPFFLAPRPCRARGVGEVLEPLSDLPALDLVLVNPGQPLGTGAVYRALGAVPSPGWSPSRITADNLLELLHNDLAETAGRLCPGITVAARALRDVPGALGVGLSGSGPTVFGVFEDGARARRAAESIKTKGFSVVVTRSVAA